MWSLGIIAFTLLGGGPPFGGESKEEIVWNVINQELNFDPAQWEKISSDATDFCGKCLERDISKRPSVE